MSNDIPVDTAFDPWQLDAGIRETVLFLRANGFATTDSGDGVSKPADEQALHCAHVVLVCEPDQLIIEADRLAKLVLATGHPLAQLGCDDEGQAAEIQAAYDPVTRTGTIILMHFVVPWGSDAWMPGRVS